MKTIIYILAGGGFLASIMAHICVKIWMSPPKDSDFDDYYYEVEDQHPGYRRYEKWSQITMTAAIISALVLFITAYL